MPTVAVPTRRRLVSVPRHCVRVAKEMDSKSIGLCPQGFESPRCRLCDPVFFPISTILPCTWPAMPGRGSDSRSASGLRPRLSQQVIAMAVIAQLVARRSHNPKVVSSILTRRIHNLIGFGSAASTAIVRSVWTQQIFIDISLGIACLGFWTSGEYETCSEL